MVNCDLCYLIFAHLFQYNCCLRYDIRRTRTAHIFTHYINIGMEQFKDRLTDFALRNTGWIQKVGRDVLIKSQLTVDSFVKGLVGGIILFDELCLTVACKAFNIHCIVLLDGSFWTTHPNNQLSDCVLRLTFVGDYGFKEICAENTAAIDDQITQECDESTEYSGEEDLRDTGLLNEGADMETDQVTSDSVDHEDQLQQSATTQEESSDSVHCDIKPLIRFKPNLNVTLNNEPIVILDSEDEEERDVKPVIKFTPTVTVSGEPILISSDSESDSESDNENGSIQDKSDANSTVQQVPLRIKRDRKYLCYLCAQQFEMQASFIDHFVTDHENDKYKCDFCETYFDSSNRLFKHERSHLYLKHKCAVCQKLFQFPYQLAAHNTQHTRLGKHQCSNCDKMFGSKCAKAFH